MSFYEIIKKYRGFNYDKYFEKINDSDIVNSINSEKKNIYDFLNISFNLLNPYFQIIERLFLFERLPRLSVLRLRRKHCC